MDDSRRLELTMFLLSKVEGELLMEDNSVADQDGERWITGTDVGLLLCHLYENSNAVRNGIDKALEGTVTNPVEDWLYNNEDLVIDEAWKHEWVDAVYPD